MFQKLALFLFLFSEKEAPNPVTPLDWAILITEHLRNRKLLRYAPENGSSPWVVTGKSLLKNKKLTTWLKNKNCTNPQIKNHKNSHHAPHKSICAQYSVLLPDLYYGVCEPQLSYMNLAYVFCTFYYCLDWNTLLRNI